MDRPQPSSQPPAGHPPFPGTLPLQPTLAGPPPAHLVQATVSASRVGRFTVVRELGRGGMGLVLQAWDAQLQRHVAIKLIDPSLTTPEALARFQREATATAALRHPGIVAVYELGDHEGRPFFVMDLVEGESLEELLRREQRLAPRRAVELVLEVARALAHAHEQGVVHRDVKPANVLLDRAGRPRLTDFGIARAGSTELTRTGAIMGTPEYMAPEQAGDSARRHGPPADVYALGCVLYRALAGRTPIQGESLAIFLKRLFDASPAPLRSVDPTLDPALDAVVLRCLEKEPERRFADAGALARELEAWLHAPAAARGGRSTLTVALIAVVAAAVGGGAVALVGGAGREPDTIAAPSSQTLVAPPPPASEPPVTAPPPVAPSLPRQALAITCDPPGALRVARVLGAYAHKHADEPGPFALSPDRRHLLTTSGFWTHEPWGTIRLSTFPDLEELRSWQAHTSTCMEVIFTDDGRRALSVGLDGRVCLWDLEATTRPLSVLEGSGWLHDVVRLAGEPERYAVVRDRKEVQEVLLAGDRLVLGRSVHARSLLGQAAALLDGRVFVAGNPPVIVDLDGALEQLPGDGSQVADVVLSPDGTRVAASGHDDVVRVWDVTSGQLLVEQGSPRERAARGIAWLDPQRLALGCNDGAIRAWHPLTGDLEPLFTLRTAVWALEACPDGRLVVAESAKAVRLFDHRTRRESTPPEDDLRHVASMAVSPDATRLAVGDAYFGHAHVFDLRTGARVMLPTGQEWLRGIGLDARGRLVVFGSASMGRRLNLQLWDHEAKALQRAWTTGSEPRLARGLLDPSGRRGFCGGEDGRLHLWDAATETLTELTVRPGWVGAAAFTPDGRRVVTSSQRTDQESLVLSWDARTGEPGPGLTAKHPVRALATFPDSLDVVLGSNSGLLERWSLSTSTHVTTYRAHQAAVIDVAVSPDGGYVLSTSHDGFVRLSDALDGREVASLNLGRTSGDRGERVLFLPGGKAFLVGTARGVVLEVELRRR